MNSPDAGPLGKRTSSVSPPEITGEIRRQNRRLEGFRLAKTARALASVPWFCPDCGGRGAWKHQHEEIDAFDKATGEVLGKVWRGAVTCMGCGLELSKSAINRRARCGLSLVPGKRPTLQSYGERKGGKSRGGLVGTMKCGSGWECPACARAIQARDRETLHGCNLGFRKDHEAGGVYMLTMTVPHNKGHDFEALRRQVTGAFRWMQGKVRWKKKMETLGVRGTVRRLEVTHGPAGFHPHIHALMFLGRALECGGCRKARRWVKDNETMCLPGFDEERRKITEAHKDCGRCHELRAEVQGWFFGEWSKACAHVKLGQPSEANGVRLDEADRDGLYLAKMGLMELAGDGDKLGRCGHCNQYVKSELTKRGRCCEGCGRLVNRTPWQILRDYHDEPTDEGRRLWRHYCKKIRGARRLEWSRRKTDLPLRQTYAGFHRNEKGRLIRKDPQAELLHDARTLEIDPKAWPEIRNDPARLADLWSAFEDNDLQAVRAVVGDAYGDLPVAHRGLTLSERDELRDGQMADRPPMMNLGRALCGALHAALDAGISQ